MPNLHEPLSERLEKREHDRRLSTPADRAAASRRAQGLPERIQDPETLSRIATLVVEQLRRRERRDSD